MTRFHQILGNIFGKPYRLWYWRNHKHAWLWGMILAIEEMPNSQPANSGLKLKDVEEMIRVLDKKKKQSPHYIAGCDPFDVSEQEHEELKKRFE